MFFTVTEEMTPPTQPSHPELLTALGTRARASQNSCPALVLRASFSVLALSVLLCIWTFVQESQA